MALRLEIISKHRNALGARGMKEFGIGGGTIGRSLESDWVLPDPQRYLSSRHAAIDYRSGSFYIVDTSMNGVYVNGSDKPVGRGKPQRLFSGDKIRIGDIEMQVHIEEEDSNEFAVGEQPHIDPVDLAQRVEAPDPTTNDLVDAYEVTGVGLEDLLSEDAEAAAFKKAAERRAAKLRLEETSDRQPAVSRAAPATKPAPEAAPAVPKRAAAVAEPAAKPSTAATGTAPALRSPKPTPAAAASAPAAARAPAAAPEATVGASGALAAFFRGAGIAPRELADKELQLTLHLLGQIMREMIVGIREALHLRAEQKNTLRIAHTTIEPRDNNPLKFSAGIEETLSNLLFRRADEYTPAVEAVREVFRDLYAHQHALLAGSTQALNDYMSRLEPEEIEQKFNGGAKRNALIGAANKLRYWDFYKDLYQVMTQHSPEQFPQAFVEELSRAYEQRAAATAPAGRARQSRAS